VPPPPSPRRMIQTQGLECHAQVPGLEFVSPDPRKRPEQAAPLLTLGLPPGVTAAADGGRAAILPPTVLVYRLCGRDSHSRLYGGNTRTTTKTAVQNKNMALVRRRPRSQKPCGMRTSVRARPRRLTAHTGNQFCMARLYGCAGHLTAFFLFNGGGFRPGQS
jgi:hypothetical protein